MSSKRSAEHLDLELNLSYWLTALLIIVHSGAIVVLIVSSLRWHPAILVGVPAVAVSFVDACRTHLLRRGRRALRRLRRDGRGRWWVQGDEDRLRPAQLLPGSHVHPLLTVLSFRVEGQRRTRSAVLFADAADPELLRRLRVRLRTQCNTD